MSLRTRIILFNTFVLTLAFLAAAVAVAGFWNAVAPLRRAVVDETRATELARGLRQELARESATISVVLTTGGTEDAYHAADERFNQLLASAADLAADQQALKALQNARLAEAAFNSEVDRALALGDDRTQATRYLVQSVLPARDAADEALDRFVERQEMAARAAERATAYASVVALAAVVALLAIAGIAGAILSLHFSRLLLDRLSSLVRATGRVATGDREAQVPVPGLSGDELDQLGRAFNSMVAQLGEAEAAARRVDELKAHFLASVSHDLRTPLTTVRGLLETLRREDAQWDEATQREFLEIAYKESDRLTRLVANLLDLSRLEAGSLPLDREAVDLLALARRLCDDLAVPGGPLAQHRVTVSSAAGAPPLGWGDELQLRRVLENLLTNAAKFSSPQSAICVLVGAGPGGADAQVRVEDQGPGIAAEDSERIFEKFYRIGGEPAGTGLGLAICRGIVEAHGGHLWVEPGPGGVGSAFIFAVPAAGRDGPDDAAGAGDSRSVPALAAAGADA